jgi:integral membrane protein
VEAAITRYRVMAIAVGVMLILLVFVAMPVRYIGGDETLSAIISPVHGTLYIIYLAVSFDLHRKLRWPLKQMALMVVAGLLPFLAFYIERRIVRDARADLAGTGRTA